MLNLMYITNDPAVACIAQAAGVQRIFVDMEVLGKARRQGGMDTVQNAHTLEDAADIRAALDAAYAEATAAPEAAPTPAAAPEAPAPAPAAPAPAAPAPAPATRSELLVRVNPLHEPCKGFPGTKAEVDGAIAAGADIIMLPYFRTAREVAAFIELVDGRARTMPLLETAQAVDEVDDILALPGLDEIFIGLNDLHLSYGQAFMFEPLANGTVEMLARKFNQAELPWGFGGIASLGRGMLPSERIIAEHYRLRSRAAILSRSFCDAEKVSSLEVVDIIFRTGVQAIREYEGLMAAHYEQRDKRFFLDNSRAVRSAVDGIAKAKRHAATGEADA